MKHLSFLVPSLAALLLALPASPSHAAAPPGVPVVLSVSTNTAQIAGFSSATVHRILPDGHNEGMFAKVNFFLTQPGARLGNDTTVLVDTLIPGNYVFTSFTAPDGKILKVDEKKNLLGSFTVAEGKPVDLGRLVLTPINDKVVIGRSSLQTSNVELMRTAMPDTAAKFSGELASGWDAPVSDGSKALERHALSKTVGAECATERADSTVFAASRLGTILIRTLDQRWRGVHGQQLESLLCVLPVDLPETEAVAVGEFGTLVRKPKNRDVLLPVERGNLPAGNLTGIVGSPAAGWFIRHQLGNTITLLRSDKLEAGNWMPVMKIAADINRNNRRGAMFLWQTPQGLGYAGATGPIKSFDTASGAWRELVLPEGYHRVMNVVAGTNGALVVQAAKGNPIWVLVEAAFISRDRGATFKQIPMPAAKFVVPPRTHIQHDGTLLMHHPSNSLYASKDDGATWTEEGKLEDSSGLLPLRAGTLLNIGSGRYGWFTIQASKDLGKAWFPDYSTFNLAAYDAEHRPDKTAK